MATTFLFDDPIFQVKGTVGMQQNWRVICQDNGFSHELQNEHRERRCCLQLLGHAC